MNHHVLTKRGKSQIVYELFSTINCSGGRRKNLDDQHRPLCKYAFLINALASDHDVGIIETICFFDVNLKRLDIGLAWHSINKGVELREDISGDAIMPASGARHGENASIDVLMLDRGRLFCRQILFNRQKTKLF